MVAAVAGRDASCRYARLREHACIRRDGRPVFPGEECFAETSQQAVEQGRVIHAAEAVV